MVTGNAWHLVGVVRCKFPSLVLSPTPTRGLLFRVREGRQSQEAGKWGHGHKEAPRDRAGGEVRSDMRAQSCPS